MKKMTRWMCMMLAVVMLVISPLSVMAATPSSNAALNKKTKSVVTQVTKGISSKAKKRTACFKWVRKCGYLPRTYKTSGKNWEVKYAKDMLTNRKGNCYSYATAFAMMARQLGYKAVIVKGKLVMGKATYQHCWVEIAGKVYDPQMTARKDVKISIYNKSYSYLKKKGFKYTASKRYK